MTKENYAKIQTNDRNQRKTLEYLCPSKTEN